MSEAIHKERSKQSALFSLDGHWRVIVLVPQLWQNSSVEIPGPAILQPRCILHFELQTLNGAHFCRVCDWGQEFHPEKRSSRADKCGLLQSNQVLLFRHREIRKIVLGPLKPLKNWGGFQEVPGKSTREGEFQLFNRENLSQKQSKLSGITSKSPSPRYFYRWRNQPRNSRSLKHLCLSNSQWVWFFRLSDKEKVGEESELNYQTFGLQRPGQSVCTLRLCPSKGNVLARSEAFDFDW